jgi:hypothetical protein
MDFAKFAVDTRKVLEEMLLVLDDPTITLDSITDYKMADRIADRISCDYSITYGCAFGALWHFYSHAECTEDFDPAESAEI